MSGYVYLIKNKDLYKIGITQNLEQRMKQLKPNKIISTLQTDDFESLEKELHKKYKDVRIPQSEWFRLTNDQLIDCKKILDSKKESLKGFFPTLKSKLNLVGVIFLLFTLLSAGVNWLVPEEDKSSFLDVYILTPNAFTLLVTIFLSIRAFFIGSDQYLSTKDAIKDRFQRSLAFLSITAVLIAITALLGFISELSLVGSS